MNDTNIITTPKPSTVTEERLTFEDLYLKKDFKSAAQFLLQNKQQFDSGIFHYNLGTVYSKMEDFAAARLHLEKAIKEGYVNSSSLNNLRFVKSQLKVYDLSTSESFADTFMDTALSLPHATYLSGSLFLLLLGIILLKSKILVRKFSIAFFSLLVIAPLVFSFAFLSHMNYAIALKEIIIYEGPSKVFSEKGKVLAGSKIILGDYQEGWFYIKYPMTFAGWINKDQLGIY